MTPKFRQAIKSHNITKAKLKELGDFKMFGHYNLTCTKGVCVFLTALVDMSVHHTKRWVICSFDYHGFTEETDLLVAIPELKEYLENK